MALREKQWEDSHTKTAGEQREHEHRMQLLRAQVADANATMASLRAQLESNGASGSRPSFPQSAGSLADHRTLPASSSDVTALNEHGPAFQRLPTATQGSERTADAALPPPVQQPGLAVIHASVDSALRRTCSSGAALPSSGQTAGVPLSGAQSRPGIGPVTQPGHQHAGHVCEDSVALTGEWLLPGTGRSAMSANASCPQDPLDHWHPPSDGPAQLPALQSNIYSGQQAGSVQRQKLDSSRDPRPEWCPPAGLGQAEGEQQQPSLMPTAHSLQQAPGTHSHPAPAPLYAHPQWMHAHHPNGQDPARVHGEVAHVGRVVSPNCESSPRPPLWPMAACAGRLTAGPGSQPAAQSELMHNLHQTRQLLTEFTQRPQLDGDSMEARIVQVLQDQDCLIRSIAADVGVSPVGGAGCHDDWNKRAADQRALAMLEARLQTATAKADFLSTRVHCADRIIS
jgi:hypothetical protein